MWRSVYNDSGGAADLLSLSLQGSGCLQKPCDTADSRHQPPSIEFSSKHIYENDHLYQHRELSRL